MSNEIFNRDVEHILNTKFTIPVGADYDPEVLEKLTNFKVKNSDIYLIGHAKTGKCIGWYLRPECL